VVREVEAVGYVRGDPNLVGNQWTFPGSIRLGGDEIGWRDVPKSLCAARALMVPERLCL